jgi:hypothetical protein
MTIAFNIAPRKDRIYYITAEGDDKNFVYFGLVSREWGLCTIWHLIIGPLIITMFCSRKNNEQEVTTAV